MNQISQELIKRFSKITCKPSDYGFYWAMYEYMDFVYNNETIFAILEKEKNIYHEHHQLINDAWRRARDQSGLTNEKLIDGIDTTFSRQVYALEKNNLYCRFLAPKSIHYIIEESLGLELFKTELEAIGREDTTYYLQEIRFDKISKRNRLVHGGGAEEIFKCLTELHFGLLDRLFEESAEKQNQNQTEESLEATAHELTIEFDEEKSILLFRGEKIPIAIQDKKTMAHKILVYMLIKLDDPTQEFYFSEMADDPFFADREYHENKNAWQRYYRACKDINEKIRKSTATKIEDFLIVNTSKTARVMINPKYLGNSPYKGKEEA